MLLNDLTDYKYISNLRVMVNPADQLKMLPKPDIIR